MPFIRLSSALRTSLPLAALVVLSACGGGGGDEPAPADMADLNPSLTSATVLAALPNATKLVSVPRIQTGGNFSTTVGTALPYTYSLTGTDIVTLTGTTATQYDFYELDGFMMLCRNTAPLKAEAVISAPYVTAARPAKQEELAGKTFQAIEGCDEDTSVPQIGYKSDGTAVITDGSATVTISQANLRKYFSETGIKDGNDLHRGHIYQVSVPYGSGTSTSYVIVETYRENNEDGIAMYVQVED